MNHKENGTPKIESIIISLIENDIITTRLLNGLRDLSLKSLEYNLNLHEIIFWHIGFQEDEITEELTDWYFTKTNQVSKLKAPITNKEYHSLACGIYADLMAKIHLPDT